MCTPGKCMQKDADCETFLFFLNKTMGWRKNRKNQHAYTFEIF